MYVGDVEKKGTTRSSVDPKLRKKKGSEESSSIEEKTSKEEGWDVYLASSRTHADHEVWLVDPGASFHMTPHREWFYEYERYDGGDVFLGDEPNQNHRMRKSQVESHGWNDYNTP